MTRARPAPCVIDRVGKTRLVIDEQHLRLVVDEVMAQARVSLWIATANVKDMMVEAPIGTVARARGRYVSVIERLAGLARRGVELRMIHATKPSRAFRASLERRVVVRNHLAMRQCVRNHMKLIIVDGRVAYVGSANFTGAGLGAKAPGRRNFELGLMVDDDVLLDVIQGHFEHVWQGEACVGCRLRSACPAPIDGLPGRGEYG